MNDVFPEKTARTEDGNDKTSKNLSFVEAVQKGLEEARNGRTVSLKEAKKTLGVE